MFEKKKVCFLSLVDINLLQFRLPIMLELIKQGFDVYACCPAGELSHQFKKYHIKHIPWSLNRKSINPFKELISIGSLYVILNKLKPELVQSFTIKPNIYLGLVSKFLNINQSIVSVTGLGCFFSQSDLKSSFLQKLILILYKFSLNRFVKVMFQNQDDMNFFIKRGIVSKTQCYLIKSSGIDTNKWTRSLFLPTKSIHFVMISRLIKQKGILLFCEAAKKMKLLYKEKVNFYLIGDVDSGNQYSLSISDIKSYIDDDSIIYKGWSDDVCKELSNHHIFVFPSAYREGIPRASIEAASMSMPIITTNSVGCREVVDDEVNGFLLRENNVDTLVNAMKMFVLDENLIIKMGKASRKKSIKEFDIRHIIKRYFEMYQF